ncbi:MAG TPA: hypothetical protein DCE78_05695, partial [Bacteroidetes bacterium]|nr:hypothetical protein [Bacteroidota bacterium]
DLDRALILGSRSFGKGLVQIVRPLSYNNSLKITTSRYYIPSGRSIQSAIYTHQDAGHSMQIPDSLRKAFKTQNGRIVYDGVGIDPDISVEEPSQKLVEIALLQNSAYFFYANEYRSKNATFDAKSIDDEMLDDFFEYLDRTNFDYVTRVERHLTSLQNQLKEDGISVDESVMVNLDTAVENQKFRELWNASDVIRKELFLELTARYSGQVGRFEAAIKSDSTIIKATELFRNPTQIANVLGE